MQTLGRYELIETLGQGGMGTVYRSFDTLLQRVVAVKVISRPIHDNPELRERFFREARAAGKLAHKNIITIHDLGEHEGQPYLAMEYLSGEDLQRRLARPEKISLAHKVDVAVEICEALEYAHARGVIHRDIKPANIFITENGSAKILDFGLARLMTSELTSSNMLMGTVNYMAPEQVQGQRADNRSDIFSVGVVLYELFGGRKAFEGDSFASTLYKILQEVPEPLQRLDATLPPALVSIVERSLAKPRDERYQEIGDLRRDLSAIRHQIALSELPGDAVTFVTPLPGAYQRPGSGSGGLTPPPMPPVTPRPSDAVTLPMTPAPFTSGQPATPVPAVQPSRRRGTMRAVAMAVVAVVALVGAWTLFGRRGRQIDTTPAQPRAQNTTTTPSPEEALRRAADAFAAQDFPGAERQAAAVLQQYPDNAEARRMQTRARDASAAVERALQRARTARDAGQYDEASRAAGEVLSIAPSNAEAKRIMEEGTTQSRGRGADAARRRMIDARAASRGANAQALASGAYRHATKAEQDADRLYRSGRLPEAMAGFYEAAGLYRSAEIAAGAEAARRTAERAAAAAAPPAASAPPPPTTSAAPIEPTSSATAPRGTSSSPTVPAAPPVVAAPPPLPPGRVPDPAATPAPPAAQPAETTARAEDAIADLIERYRAALQARSLDALRRVWPSLTGAQQDAFREEFQHASRIDVQISNPQISVSGNSGTATFTRRYELQTVDGQRQRAISRTTIDVRRSGAGWVIENIRFDAAR